LNPFAPAAHKCAASRRLGLDAERLHICVHVAKNVCAESARPARSQHTCGIHGKVPVRSFDRDLSRSCDRRDDASRWSCFLNPAQRRLKLLKGREAPAGRG
ncbi:unnamed protein product, partial [Staurois parvus]